MADIRIPTGPLDAEPLGAIGYEHGQLTAANRQALAQALDGLELGEWDRRIAEWLTGWEPSTVATICAWLTRVRAIPDPDTIVLDRPAELGMTWHDGGPLLELGDEGICLFPRGADEYWMDPSEAREWAAQLAAMAETLPARRPSVGGGPDIGEEAEEHYRLGKEDL